MRQTITVKNIFINGVNIVQQGLLAIHTVCEYFKPFHRLRWNPNLRAKRFDEISSTVSLYTRLFYRLRQVSVSSVLHFIKFIFATSGPHQVFPPWMKHKPVIYSQHSYHFQHIHNCIIVSLFVCRENNVCDSRERTYQKWVNPKRIYTNLMRLHFFACFFLFLSI